MCWASPAEATPRPCSPPWGAVAGAAALTTGSSYTLYRGADSIADWTQESGTMGASGTGGFGGGNMGGMGGQNGGFGGGRR